MLFAIQEVISIKVCHDVTGKYMLHLFAQDTGERYWPITDSHVFLTLLKHRGYMCLLPRVWGFTSSGSGMLGISE